MRILNKTKFLISKLIPTLIFLPLFFFKQGENIFKNLALHRYVDKEFLNLFDGDFVRNESLLKVKFPIQINLEAEIYVKEVVIYKIKKSKEKNRSGVLKIYTKDFNTICGSSVWPELYQKKVRVTCFREVRSPRVFVEIRNEDISISEIEIYGLLIENSSFPYFFPSGCFKQNSIPVSSLKNFISVQKCILHCRKLQLHYIALNLKKCGCLKEKPIQTISNFGNCEEKCFGLYFCGKDENFRVIEDRNLCIEYSTNPCNKKISYCVHNLTYLNCFCTKNNKKINFYSRDFACDISNFFNKRKKLPKKKNEKISGNKTIILGPVFPPKIIFDIEVFNITKLKFKPGCYSNLTSCVITLQIQKKVFCPEEFKNENFDLQIEKNKNFKIEFRNKSIKKPGLIKCQMELIVKDVFTDKSVDVKLTQNIYYQDDDYYYYYNATENINNYPVFEKKWYVYIAIIIAIFKIFIFINFLLLFRFGGKKV